MWPALPRVCRLFTRLRPGSELYHEWERRTAVSRSFSCRPEGSFLRISRRACLTSGMAALGMALLSDRRPAAAAQQGSPPEKAKGTAQHLAERKRAYLRRLLY